MLGFAGQPPGNLLDRPSMQGYLQGFVWNPRVTLVMQFRLHRRLHGASDLEMPSATLGPSFSREVRLNRSIEP